jgi:hypothetical protein
VNVKPCDRVSEAEEIFLSYCPVTAPPVFPLAAREPVSPLDFVSSDKSQSRFRDRDLSLRHSARNDESLRRRIIKLLAANRVSRFLSVMISARTANSKLSAWNTRQQGRRLVAAPVEQLGKGETPVASPVRRLVRHAETVPVSVPFDLYAAALEVHP